jgi:Zn finger protein HypA/HybF involved in hydrogenase expression
VSTARQSAAGTTRKCPHCRAVILESASVCPACRKYLRFDSSAAARAIPTFSPLRVEGAFRHPDNGQAWEYSVMVSIKNDRGEEVTRHVVGVGALQPGEERTFTFAVEVFAPPDSTR